MLVTLVTTGFVMDSSDVLTLSRFRFKKQHNTINCFATVWRPFSTSPGGPQRMTHEQLHKRTSGI